VGKVDNGIVSVNAYGVYSNITFPLMVKVFKPKGTLKAGDQYKTKIELASEIITALVEEGFEIELERDRVGWTRSRGRGADRE
jgi:SRSO17 transposase